MWPISSTTIIAVSWSSTWLMVTMLPSLHQRLDDFGRLDRHLVRQVGDGDGFRHRDFAHDRLGRAPPTGSPPWRSRGLWCPLLGCASRPPPPATSPAGLDRPPLGRSRPSRPWFPSSGFSCRPWRPGRLWACAACHRWPARRRLRRAWPMRLLRLRLFSSAASASFRVSRAPAFSRNSSDWRAINSAWRFWLLRRAARPALRRPPARAWPALLPPPPAPGLPLAAPRASRLTNTRFLAHFDLDGARLAGRVRFLDLGGLLARQRDLALRLGGAMRLAQVLEQPRLVLLGQRVLGLLLVYARRPSCSSSTEGGTFSSLANCATLVWAMPVPLTSPGLCKPMGARAAMINALARSASTPVQSRSNHPWPDPQDHRAS